MRLTPPTARKKGPGFARQGLTRLMAMLGKNSEQEPGTTPDLSTVPGSGKGKPQKIDPSVKLTDPDNKESELGPGETEDSDNYDPTEEELAEIALLEERFRVSSDARRPHEGRWVEGLAFYNSDQWGSWDTKQGRLVSLMEPNDPYRTYVTHNKVRSKADKVIARGLQSKIDTSLKPYSSLDSDIIAAREGTDFLQHIDEILNLQAQVQRLLTGAVIVGPQYEEFWFDPTAVVPVPVFDDKMQIVEIKESAVGEVCSKIRSCFSVLRDPKAEQWGDDAYIIVYSYESLEYIRKAYPEKGKFVGGEGDSGMTSRVESILNTVTGDVSKGANSAQKGAWLKRMYEKPSLAYQQGRYIHVANGVEVWSGPMPYPKLKGYPLAPLPFREGIETPYGDNAITPAIEPQRGRNRAVSRLYDRLNNGDGKLLAPAGSEISPNAFKSARRNEVITYQIDQGALGAKPEYLPNPPLDPATFELIQLCDGDINDALQVHEVSESAVPPGVTAAGAIQALQDADKSDSAILTNNIVSYHKVRTPILVAIGQQCYNEPRQLMVSQTAPDQVDDITARQTERMEHVRVLVEVLSKAGVSQSDMPAVLESLPSTQEMGQGQPGQQGQPTDPQSAARTRSTVFKEFGTGRIVPVITSTSTKSPAARIQTILDMARTGMFAPENLPVTIFLLGQMELEDTDKLTRDLKFALQQIQKQRQAEQPDPAALEKIKAEQRAEELAAVTQAKIEEQTAVIGAKSQAELAKIEAQSNAKPKVSLSGPLPPAGVIAAAEEAGLDIYGGAEHVTAMAKIDPAAAAPYGQMPLPDPDDKTTGQKPKKDK